MFLDPQCSLMDQIPVTIWNGLGVLQLAAGILIWLPSLTKYVAGFFFIFMLSFVIFHLTQSSYDMGGAIFMSILMGLLFWNPDFIKAKKPT